MVNRAGRQMAQRPQKSRFTYTPRDAATYKQHSEQTGGGYDNYVKEGTDTFRPKEGDNVIRVLPPTWDGHKYHGYELWAHSFIGPNRGNYLCPAKMNGEYCPICEYELDLKNDGETEAAQKVKAVKKYAMWILDRSEREPTPKFYEMGWMLDRDFAALAHNPRTGRIIYIDHPDEGFDLMFKRKGQNMTTKYYGAQIDREARPIHDDPAKQDALLEFVMENPVPSMLQFHDVERMKAALFGTAEQPDELDKGNGEEQPTPRVRAHAAPAETDTGEDNYQETDDQQVTADEGEEQPVDEEQPQEGDEEQQPVEGDEEQPQEGDEEQPPEPEPEPPPPRVRPVTQRPVAASPARPAAAPARPAAARPSPARQPVQQETEEEYDGGQQAQPVARPVAARPAPAAARPAAPRPTAPAAGPARAASASPARPAVPARPAAPAAARPAVARPAAPAPAPQRRPPPAR